MKLAIWTIVLILLLATAGIQNADYAGSVSAGGPCVGQSNTCTGVVSDTAIPLSANPNTGDYFQWFASFPVQSKESLTCSQVNGDPITGQAQGPTSISVSPDINTCYWFTYTTTQGSPSFYTSPPYLIEMSTAQNFATAICNPLFGIGTGQPDNPYDYNFGWQGAGDYINVPTQSDNVIFIGNLGTFNSYSGGNPQTTYAALANVSNFNSLIEISFLIVLLMFIVIGICYGVGTAFGLDSLKNFSRTEVIESTFNIVVILLIATASGFGPWATSLLTNVGLAAIAPVVTNTNIPGATFPNLCINYMNLGFGRAINGFLGSFVSLWEISAIQGFEVQLMPNGFGVSFAPYQGLWPLQQIIYIELDVYLTIGGTMAAIGLLLFVIYFIFPVFLYVGILLRSFPWTRAAGGSIIALFVAFYVIFPALLYTFSVLDLYPSASYQLPNVGSALNNQDFAYFQTLIPGFFGNAVVTQIAGFTYAVSYSVLQLFGVIISFLISFDLVDRLGDLLGAPSLQGRTLFSKVI